MTIELMGDGKNGGGRRDKMIFLLSFPCLTRESIRIAETAWMPDHPVK